MCRRVGFASTSRRTSGSIPAARCGSPTPLMLVSAIPSLRRRSQAGGSGGCVASFGAGVAGFRCLEPQLVPASVWRHVTAALEQDFPHCRFLAWTPGLVWRDVFQLKEVGFAAAFSSLPWWDGRASWFVEEHELLRTIGSIIACPEAPFGPRLARRF